MVVIHRLKSVIMINKKKIDHSSRGIEKRKKNPKITTKQDDLSTHNKQNQNHIVAVVSNNHHQHHPHHRGQFER